MQLPAQVNRSHNSSSVLHAQQLFLLLPFWLGFKFLSLLCFNFFSFTRPLYQPFLSFGFSLCFPNSTFPFFAPFYPLEFVIFPISADALSLLATSSLKCLVLSLKQEKSHSDSTHFHLQTEQTWVTHSHIYLNLRAGAVLMAMHSPGGSQMLQALTETTLLLALKNQEMRLKSQLPVEK